MATVVKRVCVVAVAAMLLVACSELEDLMPALERLTEAITDEEGGLADGIAEGVADTVARTRGGGTDVTVTARVSAVYDVAEAEFPLYGWSGTIEHEVTGVFAGDGTWLAPRSHATGTAEGYDICYDDDGSVRQTDWASELHWPGFEPQVELELQGDDVAVLYALDWQVGFEHPGAPACGPGSPTPAGPDVTYFAMRVLDGERSPDAETSSRPGIQDGIVVLRIPVDDLTAGGSWSATLSTSGAEDGESATLHVDLEVRSD